MPATLAHQALARPGRSTRSATTPAPATSRRSGCRRSDPPRCSCCATSPTASTAAPTASSSPSPTRRTRSASASATATRSPIVRTLRRLTQFDLACEDPMSDTVAVRRNVPPVNRRHLRRLPSDAPGRARRVGRGAARRAAARRPRAAAPGASRSRCSSRATTPTTSSGRCTRSASTPRSATRARSGRTSATATRSTTRGDRSRRHRELTAAARPVRARHRAPGRMPSGASVVPRDAPLPRAHPRTVARMADDAQLDRIAALAARRAPDRRAHRRRDLHRVGHPRLPRAAGRLDEEPRGREDGDAPALRRATPSVAAQRVAEPARAARCWTAEPNAGHRALAELERSANVAHARHPERRRPAPRRRARRPSIVIEIHGTVHEAKCLPCGWRGPMEETLDRVRAGEEDPACLECGGILKSATISLRREPRARGPDRARSGAAAGADLFLALGTSLGVYPAAGAPRDRAPRTAPRS